MGLPKRSLLKTTLKMATFFLITASCASGPCKQEFKDNAMTKTSVQSIEELRYPAHKRVFVYKPDGTLQCKQGQLIAVETLLKEFKEKNITVFSNKHIHNGLMQIQMCGASTGMIYVFEIPSDSMNDASKMDFKEFAKPAP